MENPKIRAILGQITLTNVLLLAIAVFLCLNWMEERKIAQDFGWMNHLLSNIDIDLTR
jgi:hypothetical protein